MDLGQVEHVGRAAELEHHIVGQVDQRRDRALAGALESFANPGWRGRPRVHPTDHPTAEAPAQLGRIDPHLEPIGDRDRGRIDPGQHERRAGDRGDFARHTRHRHAVREVGRELEQPHLVVENERVAQRRADLQRVVEHQQAAVIVRQTQLARRTQHPAALDATHLGDADLHAARQLGPRQRTRYLDPGGDVGCAADDLMRSRATDVHPAHRQLVGVRMALHLEHLRHHHLREGRRHRHALLHLESGHRQRMGECIAGERRIGVGPQPPFGEFHRRALSR